MSKKQKIIGLKILLPINDNEFTLGKAHKDTGVRRIENSLLGPTIHFNDGTICQVVGAPYSIIFREVE